MKPDEDRTKPVPPVEDQAPVEEPLEPPEWTLTAEDIAEIQASGLTLGDVIRELESRAE